jgi:hypothetical protein
VLEAQQSLYGAQDSLAQSDQQLIDDLIAIYKALGGGWDIDVQTPPGFGNGSSGEPAGVASTPGGRVNGRFNQPAEVQRHRSLS